VNMATICTADAIRKDNYWETLVDDGSTSS